MLQYLSFSADHGQLGIPPSSLASVLRSSSPTEVKETPWNNDDDAPAILCAGRDHSLIVTEAGRCYSAGSNEQGQLGREGDGNTFKRVSAEVSQ